MTDGPLTGGNNSREVVRIGKTVRRARDHGSEFAAKVLTFLEARGYPYAPRFHGVDGQDRDILSYIPGQTTDHPAQRAPGAYARGGSMLRLLHELTTGRPLAGGHECVIHGDAGPFNTIFRDGMPVAFIDWSSCRPGERLEDLGYMAWTWCIQSQGRVPAGDQAAHLRELRDGYGPIEAADLLDAIVASQTKIADLETANMTDPRFPAARREFASRAIAWATADRALVRQHEQLLLAALR